ncbi:MAG: hypothetical protein ABII79_03140 [bacterium]
MFARHVLGTLGMVLLLYPVPVSNAGAESKLESGTGDITTFSSGYAATLPEWAEDVDSGAMSNSLAEYYLQRLSTKDRNRRIVSGIINVIVGQALVFVGLEATRLGVQEPGWAAGTVVTGSGCLLSALGATALGYTSKAEREYKRLARLPTSQERKHQATAALRVVSDRAAEKRIVTGLTYSALSAFYAAALPFKRYESVPGFYAPKEKGSEWNYAIAGVFGAAALYCFVISSPDEKAYRQFSNEVEQQAGPKLSLAINSTGRDLMLAAVASF